MSTFGIDLGTTNSVISHLVEGRPTPIEVEGNAIVPSVVLYETDRVIVGRPARNLQLQFPERTLRSVKRKMGTDHVFSVNGRSVTPEEASAEILKALKEGAEKATGQKVHDVVITVPAYFDDAQRKATLRAGELAGLNVLRLLNEPTSASLVYDRVGEAQEGSVPELVLIYDLGGGTFDVSVLEVFGEVREVRSTTGNTMLGGDDFDEKLVQHFLDLLRVQGVDPREDLRAMARLTRIAEDTKIALSSKTEVTVHEEFLTTHNGRAVHLKAEITRAQFEDMIASLLDSTLTLTRKALEDAGVREEELSRVCLVGGSTRIPRVRRMLEDAIGTEVHEEIDPDMAVALGASIQCALLSGEPVGRILVDVTSHSLGVLVMDDDGMDADTFAPIIRRNTVLPAVRTEVFATVQHNQPAVKVEVYQGESSRASENTLVGEFMFELKPAPAHSPVRCEFAYDLDGVVKVSVAQTGTDNQTSVALSVSEASRPRPALSATSAVERKAHALLESLTGERHEKLRALLDLYVAAPEAQRESREEALLDFFIEHDE